MRMGTKVSWLVAGNVQRGNGVTITDEAPDGTILVAVNSMFGEPNAGFHPVIHCTVTWLTIEK